MTRKTFTSLLSLFGGAIPPMALERVRGMTDPLGRGWVQVSAHRAVLRPTKLTGEEIRNANARNGVGSSKVRKARLREIQKYRQGGKSELARIVRELT